MHSVKAYLQALCGGFRLETWDFTLARPNAAHGADKRHWLGFVRRFVLDNPILKLNSARLVNLRQLKRQLQPGVILSNPVLLIFAQFIF